MPIQAPGRGIPLPCPLCVSFHHLLPESLWVSHVLATFPPLPISVPCLCRGYGLCAEGKGCLHSNSAAGYLAQLLSSGSVFHTADSTWRTHLSSMDPHHHPKIRLATGHGAGWVPDPRAFLDLSPRCSSEELLDRLFKKSVVTEAEVTLQPGLSAEAIGLHAYSTRPPTPPALTACSSRHSMLHLRDHLGVSRALGSVTTP